MAARSSGLKKYVVLPARGISSDVMTADIFASRGGGDIGRKSLDGDDFAFAAKAVMASAAADLPPAIEALAQSSTINVLSQYFSDGPAVVEMDDAGRVALGAMQPGVRILPLTRYRVADGARGNRAHDGRLFTASGAPLTVPDAFGDARQHYAGAVDADAGKGVTIGVIDTGVDGAHPALAGQVDGGRSLVHGEDASDGGPVNWPNDPRAGHGTHVAAIIAGKGVGGFPSGLAPGARIRSYRIFPHNRTSGLTDNQSVIIDAIVAAINDGCHVINLSIQMRKPKEDGVRSAIADAWSNGVLCIAAAGNDFRKTVGYPAALPNCIAVSAIGRDGCFPSEARHNKLVTTDRGADDPAAFLTAFTNTGPQIRFAAPGHAIVSAGIGGIWESRSGTSMASPFVAGVAAALLSKNANILNAKGDETRSAAMLQMLNGRARRFGFRSLDFEGLGLPLP